MRKSLLFAVCFLFSCTSIFAADDAKMLEEVRQILKTVPLIDGHNDVPWVVRDNFAGRLDKIDLRSDTRKLQLDPPMDTDIARLKEGGLGAQFWSAYVPVEVAGSDAVQAVFEQIDIIHNLCQGYPDVFEMAYTAADIERIHPTGKIACLIGVEGGHTINDSPAMLRQLYRAGARYMTLTHSQNTNWADSATAKPEHGGLTDFGRQIVEEMNRLGMMIDLSHVSPDTMNDALDASKAPVIFSHSSVGAFSGHPRDVPDAVLKRLPANGGVVMVNLAPAFITEQARQYAADKDGEKARLKALYPQDPDRAGTELKTWSEEHPLPRPSVPQVADHIDYLRKNVGIDFIGIGADLDGLATVPAGIDDVAGYPLLFVELLKRGYSKDEIAKIAGLNILRVMKQCERVAAGMQKTRRPLEIDLKKLSTPE